MNTGTFPQQDITAVFKPDDRQFENCLLIFQKGVFLPGRSDVTVHHFLRNDLNLSPEYVENRIQTIFLNGKPVDDLLNQKMAVDSTIALSGAMPGLVGAIFRRNSAYKVFRDGISSDSDTKVTKGSSPCLFRLKLFNNIIREVGTPLLKSGIFVKLNDFRQYLQMSHGISEQNLEKLYIGNEEKNLSSLGHFNGIETKQLVQLRVEAF